MSSRVVNSELLSVALATALFCQHNCVTSLGDEFVTASEARHTLNFIFFGSIYNLNEKGFRASSDALLAIYASINLESCKNYCKMYVEGCASSARFFVMEVHRCTDLPDPELCFQIANLSLSFVCSMIRAMPDIIFKPKQDTQRGEEYYDGPGYHWC